MEHIYDYLMSSDISIDTINEIETYINPKNNHVTFYVTIYVDYDSHFRFGIEKKTMFDEFCEDAETCDAFHNMFEPHYNIKTKREDQNLYITIKYQWVTWRFKIVDTNSVNY